MSDDRQNDDLVFGKNAVLAFLSAGQEGDRPGAAQVSKVFLSDGMRPDARIEEIKRLAKQAGVAVTVMERRRLDRMVGPDDRHQGVIAQVSQVAMIDLDDYLKQMLASKNKATQSEGQPEPILAVLDGIEDPHNLGAIIRVAECAGVSAILLPNRRSASLTGTVARTSAGALANMPMIRIGNIVQAMKTLKDAGFWLAGLDAEAQQNYFEADLTGPLAIVVGSEGNGLSRLVAENCDFLISIPMFGKTNSLNASVAFAVVLYELVRQRQSKKTKH